MLQSKYKIYVDLDGVLVDWETQFKRYSGGVDPEKYRMQYGDKRSYNLVLNNSPEFYATAPWMVDGKVLYNFLKNLPCEVLSHSTDSQSTDGKKQWLHSNNIEWYQNLVPNRSDKAKFATPNSVLIDDRRDVIEEFNNAGGIGILHTNATDTINQLKSVLGIKEKFRIYNSILNPAIWDGYVLKTEVLEKLLNVANAFYKSTELDVPVEDILLIGSVAGYNWSPTSDIDLHILIDFNKIDCNKELVKNLVDSYKNKWNDQHRVYIKDHPVEVYIQDINEVNRSNAVYSVLTNEWIKKPSIEKVKINKDDIKTSYYNLVKNIDAAIKSEDLSKMKEIVKHIYDMRESGLSTVGDLSTENIVFKLLRTSGYIAKLRTSINVAVTKSLH